MQTTFSGEPADASPFTYKMNVELAACHWWYTATHVYGDGDDRTERLL